ncbi:uncharacterized protein F5147DRAFT_315533 [Suillus discolor]|uniref:Uncharacterized protein n=1 Tax=Suillus discolor TaxID=1912936 RepID=A0A9P7JRJ4_9AGAM|nr:uncharacterized protein F5147DRAFT_315533 [Suillus discolor]KAG2101350.1 hypothetical protein F5147DRAFT_315533 [Suillus discolor]
MLIFNSFTRIKYLGFRTIQRTGYGVYLLAYEKLVQRKMTWNGIRGDQMDYILYGATAGYALWTVIRPIDMIRSRV